METNSAEHAELASPTSPEVDGSSQRLAEDVAAFLEQADLKGWPYQDFSVTRRADRARGRHRATVMKLETELRAKSEAERAAIDADAAARNRQDAPSLEKAAREPWGAQARRLAPQPATQHNELSRREQGVRRTETAEERGRAEWIEARSASVQEGSGWRRFFGTAIETPKQPLAPGGIASTTFPDLGDMLPERFPRRDTTVWTRTTQLLRAEPDAPEEDLSATPDEDELFPSEGRFTAAGDAEALLAVEQYADLISAKSELTDTPEDTSTSALLDVRSESASATTATATKGTMPSWIVPEHGPAHPEHTSPPETLQHARHRVASRWYALREIFTPTHAEENPAVPYPDQLPPILAVFSVAGGVGKTTLTATLGRALASQGERVLLVDTTSRAMLPVFFGGHDIRPAEVRTFVPPSSGTDQPVHVVSYPTAEQPASDAGESTWIKDLQRDGKGFNRILVDLSTCAGSALAQLVELGAQVLVPLTPDMNSVLSLTRLERLFAGLLDREGNPAHPFFLLNMFEATQPLSLDIRSLLLEQLNGKLVSTVIRRSSLVGEALAEGMTVIDYAPADGIVKEYTQLVGWLRNLTEPARQGIGHSRWSER
jgi:cellulose synthase operon protein YhjQ